MAFVGILKGIAYKVVNGFFRLLKTLKGLLKLVKKQDWDMFIRALLAKEKIFLSKLCKTFN